MHEVPTISLHAYFCRLFAGFVWPGMPKLLKVCNVITKSQKRSFVCRQPSNLLQVGISGQTCPKHPKLEADNIFVFGQT